MSIVVLVVVSVVVSVVAGVVVVFVVVVVVVIVVIGGGVVGAAVEEGVTVVVVEVESPVVAVVVVVVAVVTAAVVSPQTPSPSGSFNTSPRHESSPSHKPSASSSQHAWGAHASAFSSPCLATHAAPNADASVVTVNVRVRSAGPQATEQLPHGPHEPWQSTLVTTRLRK